MIEILQVILPAIAFCGFLKNNNLKLTETMPKFLIFFLSKKNLIKEYADSQHNTKMIQTI
jgi:hypothetical protein